MAIHTAPQTCPRAGEKIVTDFWGKSQPTEGRNKPWNSWCAWFDNDEPDDEGNMLQGYGSTEREAVANLIIKLEMPQ